MPSVRLRKASRLSMLQNGPARQEDLLPSTTASNTIYSRRTSLPRTPLAEIFVDELDNGTGSSKPMDLDTIPPDSQPQTLSKAQTPALVYKKHSHSSSVSYENLRRASLTSQISSRQGSLTSKRKRGEGSSQRRSDASNLTERRTSLPAVSGLHRPLDYTGEHLQPIKPPTFDPRIYDKLSSFTFGAPLPPPSPTYTSSQPSSSRPNDQSYTETETSAYSTDEEERARDERAKLRAVDDGSRRPSLPINIPQPDTAREGRRSSLFKVASSVNHMHLDDIRQSDNYAGVTGSLPSRLEPKPLPALPSGPSGSQGFSAYGMGKALRSQLNANGFDLKYIMDNPSETGSSAPASNAAPSETSSAGGEDRERSPQPVNASALLDSAQMQQAILDQEWGTAFHFPGNLSPRGSIDDPFARMVDQFDPTYKTNRHGWTFKRHPHAYVRKAKASAPRTSSEEQRERSNRGEGANDPHEKIVESFVWECTNIGKYAMTPGKSHLGENRRPYVLTGITPDGSRRKGPAYLIHKHSRCHAFSVFQGYHVTGQKILASHAILLACKDLQISFAHTPEVRKAPHEPYEDDPEVQKLQTHNLMDDEPSVPRSSRPRHRGHTVHAVPAQPASTNSSPRAKTQSAKASIPENRQRRLGPSSFADTEVDKSRIAQLIDKEESIASNSTITPQPKQTSHAVAFDAVDHAAPPEEHSLSRGGSSKGFDWIRRAFGPKQPLVPHVAAKPPTPGPPSASLDGTYSPPWLLMTPSSVKQEEERIIKNLNDSFRAVGLIPPPKAKQSHNDAAKAKAKATAEKMKHKTLLESIPDDAMIMLLPLWVSEGLSQTGVVKHHTPMADRTYLLVYYVPFDTKGNDEPRIRPSNTRRRPRTHQGRIRSDERTLKRPTSHSVIAQGERRTEGGHARNHSAENAAVKDEPKNTSFRIVARLLPYAEVKECGIKLPRFGLAVDGALSDALVGNPQYLASEGGYSAVVGICSGRDSGLQLVMEGLDRLGLRRHSLQVAEEQQIALGAMEMDQEAIAVEMSAQLEPLTPIGKAVVETLLAGCLSILEFGF